VCYLSTEPREGLRALERWAKCFPERRWAVENAGGLGRHLAGRLCAADESVVDVPPKLSARVRVLSSGNARKNDGLDALATALAASRNERLAAVDPEADSEVLRLLSERRGDLACQPVDKRSVDDVLWSRGASIGSMSLLLTAARGDTQL
jgi:transposase